MTRSEIHLWQTDINAIIDKLNTLGDAMDENTSIRTTEYNDLAQAIAHLESVAETLGKFEERQSRTWPDTFTSFINNL